MKKIVLAVAGTVLATPLVFAQAKNFEGFSIGASLANAKTSIESTTGASTAFEGTSTGIDLNAQYNWALGQAFVLGVGVTVGTGNNKVGSSSSVGDIVTKNRAAVEFVPGYAVSNDMLIYGKIASLAATGANDVGVSSTYAGIGYGIGLRGMMNKNMYWQIGYDMNQYAEKSNEKLKSSVFSLGMGYKF